MQEFKCYDSHFKTDKISKSFLTHVICIPVLSIYYDIVLSCILFILHFIDTDTKNK